jgi:hypothetical protein
MRNPMIGLGVNAKRTAKGYRIHISFFYIVKKWHLGLNIFKLKNCMLYSHFLFTEIIFSWKHNDPLQNRMG